MGLFDDRINVLGGVPRRRRQNRELFGLPLKVYKLLRPCPKGTVHRPGYHTPGNGGGKVVGLAGELILLSVGTFQGLLNLFHLGFAKAILLPQCCRR